MTAFCGMAGGAARLGVPCSAAAGRCASPRGSLGAFIAFHAIASHKRAIVGAHKALLSSPSSFFARPALLLKTRCSRAPVSGDTSTHATARVLCVVTDSAWCVARSMQRGAPWDHCAAGCAMQEHSCALVPTYSCPWSINVLLSTVHSIPHVMLTRFYHMQPSMVIQSAAKFPNKAHGLQNWSLEHTQRTIQYNTALTVSCTLCTRVCIERAYFNDHDPLVYTRLAARLCAQ